MTVRKLKPPHEMKVVQGTAKLIRENFTIELRQQGEAPVLMQDGACFDAGGNLVESPPEWVWSAFANFSEETKAALKMTPPKAK